MTERPQFDRGARAVRFYIAGRYDRRTDLLHYAQFLECFGHTSTARWLTGAHEKPGLEGSSTDGYTADELAAFAIDDLFDIADADVLIAFTESPDVGFTSGGRHVEFGYALALGLDVAIIGPRENVFMQHPAIRQASNIMELIAHYGSGFSWVRRRESE